MKVSKNTYHLRFFLVEDSDQSVYNHIQKNGEKHLIFNEKRGQIQSIVDTYKVKTPYIFHCEDDWVYTRDKFVEDSFKIWKLIKNYQVWLESKESASRLDIFEYKALKKENRL